MTVGTLHIKMTTMYSRSLRAPTHSFFLFGPRATGKTTWLRAALPDALWFNLLLQETYLALLSEPRVFRDAVLGRAARASWVVVDEVQRVPHLLNEVHHLLSLPKDRPLRFALSGSSARKLRRLDVNLLAGRVIQREMSPLTWAELGADFDLQRVLRCGTLPEVYSSPHVAVEMLRAYVGTYLQQELQQEALVKDLGSFHRFLKIAALMHGQVINNSAVARDAAVARTTVERFFDILVDTLIGYRLEAWQPRIKVRERAKPKFYLFDPGVQRALLDRADVPPAAAELGPLLEGYVLHELRAARACQAVGGQLFYWSSGASRKEVDFVFEKGNRRIGIEVKSSSSWRREYAATLQELIDGGVLSTGVVVYRGELRQRHGKVVALPLDDFLRQVAQDLLSLGTWGKG